MKSIRDPKFVRLFDHLPAHIQKLAVKNFQLWSDNPGHPSLEFKELDRGRWSVRVGDHYRAVGLRRNEVIVWHWIGTHEKYNNLLGRW